MITVLYKCCILLLLLLLFLIYINDIVNISNTIFPILFADDTTVFVNGKHLDELETIMNQ